MTRDSGPTMDKKKIYIVDDHPVMRDGLVELISKSPELTVCGESSTAEDALEKIPEAAPDLVLIDLSLPGMSGMDVVTALKAGHPGIKMLVLTMHDEGLYAERAVRAGARGYIMKHQVARDVRTAIQTVLAGDFYLSPKISKDLLEAALSAKPSSGDDPETLLSDREKEVFRHVGKGLGATEIARILGINVKTVETYQARIREKLSLKDSAQVFQRASRWIHRDAP
jgi:DNA-binding NarL/FixJ family response regulator